MAWATPYNPAAMKDEETGSDAAERVRRTAALARLEVDDEQVAHLAPQFARILEAFQTLSVLDVSAQPGMIRAGGEEPRLRADVERPSLSADAALANAPERHEDFYSVPRAIPAAPDPKEEAE